MILIKNSENRCIIQDSRQNVSFFAIVLFIVCYCTLVMLQIRKITILKFHNILKLFFVLCVCCCNPLQYYIKKDVRATNKSQSYLNWMMNFYLCFHCADCTWFIFLISFFLFLLERLMIFFSRFVSI